MVVIGRLALGLWLLGAQEEGTPWIRHSLRTGESIADVARHYGVTLEELQAWNGIDLKKKLPRHVVLQLKPRQRTTPRQKTTHRVRKKETWDDIAARYDVTVEQLRVWNDAYIKRRTLPEGARLVMWLPSGLTFDPGPGDPRDAIVDVRDDGVSAGRPNRGRLINGVPLPESELYTIRHARLAYGTSLAVDNIQKAIADFRLDSGYKGKIFIGALSRRTGRRLSPHRSHQSGRDADIRLPAMPWVDHEGPLDREEIDWHATWLLVRSFVDTGAVQVIFLERKLFARLRAVAMRLGASDEDIDRVMAKVHHSKGHTSHIHVRFQCSPQADRCRD